MENNIPNKSYGKRPLWQWILIYLAIGGIIYTAVYYFVFADKGGYDIGNNTETMPQQQDTEPNYP